MPRLNFLGKVLDLSVVNNFRQTFNRAKDGRRLRQGDTQRLCQIIESYDTHIAKNEQPGEPMLQASIERMQSLLAQFEPYATVWCYIERLQEEREQALTDTASAKIRANQAEYKLAAMRGQAKGSIYTIESDDVRIRYGSAGTGRPQAEILTHGGWRPISGISVEHVGQGPELEIEANGPVQGPGWSGFPSRKLAHNTHNATLGTWEEGEAIAETWEGSLNRHANDKAMQDDRANMVLAMMSKYESDANE